MLECELSFDPSSALSMNLSFLFAGLTLLEKQGLLRIRRVRHCFDFKKSGKYPHRLILELTSQGKTLAFDIGDGYQDIHSPEFFDDILSHTDYYFKTSYSSEFASRLKYPDRFFRLGVIFRCSCEGNRFEKEMARYYLGKRQYKSAAYYALNEKKIQLSGDYRKFQASEHFDSYDLMMWTRLWKVGKTPASDIQKVYPELTIEQAREKSEYIYNMLQQTNEERIRLVRILKSELGGRFIGGLADDEISRSEAPELITEDDRVMVRERYIETGKGNVVNLLSKGLHGCIGARYCESFAAGRAFLTDRLVYELPGELRDGRNYSEYSSPEDAAGKAVALLDDVELIHKLESNNTEYYNKYLRPDMLMHNALKTAFPESGF